MNTVGFQRETGRLVNVKVPTLTVPVGGAGLTQDTDMPINGIIKAITVTTNNSTNAISYTVSVLDENSAVLFSQATVPENAITVINSMVPVTEDIPLMIPCTDTMTIRVLASGDPGATTGIVNINLYCE